MEGSDWGQGLRDDEPQLRAAQRAAMDYRGGWMAISAVPGSGKTFILENLIAEMIGQRGIPADRIGVFTFMRSARANLLRRVNARLDQINVWERFSDAFTIHSIALKILRLMQGDQVNLLEEYEQSRLLGRLIQSWLRLNQDLWRSLLPNQSDPKMLQKQQDKFRGQFSRMCRDVIRTAKHYRQSPEDLIAQVGIPAGASVESCLNGSLQVYQAYQAELDRQGLIDYDDVGWRALDAMEQDPALKAEVESWYDYVLEDEAQDSSPLQEDLLKAISRRTGHLVRVGDPNQSITGTFTSADPRYFRAFCQACQDPAQGRLITMDQSSRSAVPILELANHLVGWVGSDASLPLPLRQTFVPQRIQPAPPQNPAPDEAQIRCVQVTGDPAQELDWVARQAIASVMERPDRTVAILVPTNDQGFQLLERLAGHPPGQRSIQVYDLLRSNPQQQQVIQTLRAVTAYLGQPADPKSLIHLTNQLRDPLGWPESSWPQVQAWLLRVPLELWLFPTPGQDPVGPDTLDPETLAALARWRRRLVTWLTALGSPWTDVLSLVMQDLFRQPEELQLGHFLIDQLEMLLGSAPTADWHRISAELGQMEHSHLSGMPSELKPHDPAPGSITVSTLHKAKGLEWDEVLIVGLSAYEYPFRPADHGMGMSFLEGTDLSAEALAQLRGYLGGSLAIQSWDPEGLETATTRALYDYASERLRLLYVGLTRAKRRLTLTVPTLNRFDSPEQPSRAWIELAKTPLVQNC